jgi:hypothetical protein
MLANNQRERLELLFAAIQSERCKGRHARSSGVRFSLSTVFVGMTAAGIVLALNVRVSKEMAHDPSDNLIVSTWRSTGWPFAAFCEYDRGFLSATNWLWWDTKPVNRVCNRAAIVGNAVLGTAIAYIACRVWNRFCAKERVRL